MLKDKLIQYMLFIMFIGFTTWYGICSILYLNPLWMSEVLFTHVNYIKTEEICQWGKDSYRGNETYQVQTGHGTIMKYFR